MALPDLKIIEDYIKTQWKNYIPPSIDQNHLNHLEQGMFLNRNTINDIIKRLGEKPENTGTNSDIYDKSVFDTLISFKGRLEALEKDKVNNTDFNRILGDMQALNGGDNLVQAINNRLRRDVDDNANHKYTFRDLSLNGNLDVKGTSNLVGNTKITGILTTMGKTNANGGISTTDITANENVTLNKNLTVIGKITGSAGMQISQGATINGVLNTNNINTTGEIVSTGNITSRATVNGRNIWSDETMSANGDILTRGALRSKRNYIDLAYDEPIRHRLWVQGGNPRTRWRRRLNSNSSVKEKCYIWEQWIMDIIVVMDYKIVEQHYDMEMEMHIFIIVLDKFIQDK